MTGQHTFPYSLLTRSKEWGISIRSRQLEALPILPVSDPLLLFAPGKFPLKAPRPQASPLEKQYFMGTGGNLESFPSGNKPLSSLSWNRILRSFHPFLVSREHQSRATNSDKTRKCRNLLPFQTWQFSLALISTPPLPKLLPKRTFPCSGMVCRFFPSSLSEFLWYYLVREPSLQLPTWLSDGSNLWHFFLTLTRSSAALHFVPNLFFPPFEDYVELFDPPLQIEGKVNLSSEFDSCPCTQCHDRFLLSGSSIEASLALPHASLFSPLFEIWLSNLYLFAVHPGASSRLCARVRLGRSKTPSQFSGKKWFFSPPHALRRVSLGSPLLPSECTA